MKFRFAPALLFSFALSLAPLSKGADFSQPLLKNSFLTSSALAGLSSQRCLTTVRSLGLDKAKGFNKSCFSILTDFGAILDLAVVVREETGNSYPILFQHRLMEMLSDVRFPFYVNQLRDQLAMTLSYNQPFSLFATTKNFYGEGRRAMGAIAVLLQDVTPLQMHLRWAEQKTNDEQVRARIRDFSQVLSELWRLSHLPNVRDRIELYPSEMSRSLGPAKNAKLYHFYVPAHLAALAASFGYPKELSAYMAYHFNFLYEAFGQGPRISLAFRDPQFLKQEESAYDTYLGLRGAFFAVNPVANPFPVEKFTTWIQKDARGANDAFLIAIKQLQEPADF